MLRFLDYTHVDLGVEIDEAFVPVERTFGLAKLFFVHEVVRPFRVCMSFFLMTLELIERGEYPCTETTWELILSEIFALSFGLFLYVL